MREVSQISGECRGKSEIIERRRVEQLRHVANAAQDVLAEIARFLERRARAALRIAAQRHADVHLDGGQRLPDLVMKLARQRAPLLLLDIQKPRREALQI